MSPEERLAKLRALLADPFGQFDVTERGRLVLSLSLAGHSTTEIAVKLGTSPESIHQSARYVRDTNPDAPTLRELQRWMLDQIEAIVLEDHDEA